MIPDFARYVELGKLEVDDPNGMLAVERSTVENKLSERACALGADAVLIRSERYARPFVGTSVTAVAIAYEGGARPPGASVSGTCFAIGPRGELATAEHVVRGAGALTIQFPGKAPLQARLLTSSPKDDVAILVVPTETPDFLPLVPPADVANSGTKVFTFGFPIVELLGTDAKFTDGSISSLSGIQGEPRILQMTVPIQPGNSGGPVVTENGFAVGIVTSSASSLSFFHATGTLPQGINWAVKADRVLELLKRPVEPASPVDRNTAVERARRAVCAISTKT
jgi:S1-C subfamily serine protease